MREMSLDAAASDNEIHDGFAKTVSVIKKASRRR
jgi:hypothetical protein